MATRIQLRRGTAARWTAVNPILADGEVGIETDTRKFKFGNGVTRWIGLEYVGTTTDLTTETQARISADNALDSRLDSLEAASSGFTGGGGGGNQISAGTQLAPAGSTVLFSNANGITFGLSNSSVLTASHDGITSQSNQAFSAVGGSSTFQTLAFNNANGVSFSNNAGSIEASVGAGVPSPVNFSAGTTSNNLGSVVFSNSNNVSFGLNGSTITATATVATSLSNIRVSAGTTSNLLSAFTFDNANGLSFGLNASTITGSYTVPTVTNSSMTVSDAATSGTLARLAFTNQNGVTLSLSTGAGGSHTIVGSHNGLTSQSNQAFSAGAASSTFQTLSFQDSNQISFSNNAGAIRITHDLMQSTSRPAFSAGAASSTFQTLQFQDSLNVSFSNNAGSVRLTHNLAGTSTGFAGANISGSITNNSSGINLSLSVAAPGGGAAVTLSGYDGYANNELLAAAGGQATLWIDRIDLPIALQFDRVGLRITHSNATNSSGSATISVWCGFSTRNASTLSSYASTSFTTAITQSGTVGSYSNYGGIKILPIPWTTTITAGNYWFGIVTRTTTGGANMTFGNLVNSQIASTMSGYFGSGSNATAGIRLAVGVYSATTAGLPTAISITQINGNSSVFLRQPAYLFMSNIF